MAQSVKIAGALFSNVPSIRVPDENDVFHPFVDPSPTTATAADVASGKIFFAADGTQTSGTASGGSATIVSKTITSNGTYNASADSADGYDPVIVNVSGGGGIVGACVCGTITTPSTEGTVATINVPYTGNGHPILVAFQLSEGAYNNIGSAYNTNSRRAVIVAHFAKTICTGENATPTYAGAADKDTMVVTVRYKNSATYPQNTTSGGTATGTSIYKQTDPTGSTSSYLISIKSKTQIAYITNKNAEIYGLLPNTEYSYVIGYSS